MKLNDRFLVPGLIIILTLLASLILPVAVLADEVNPPEEPVVEETIDGDPAPPSVSEILEDLPENTEVVVLDEEGTLLPLASEAAAEIITDTDPMWCPVGVLPGGAGCTINFATPQLLINDMDSSNPATSASMYEQDGIIYFTASPGGSFVLVPGGGNHNIAFLGGNPIYEPDYNALKGFNLTLQGGWNGDTVTPAFSGQTDFDSNRIQIGTSANPWVGDITLNDLAFNEVLFGNSVTIHTTSGDITLNNVDVQEQRSIILNNTALLSSDSGDITVSNSSFDGDNTGLSHSNGFYANTNSGSINISNTSFTDARGLILDRDGATLSGVNITLNNVTASGNDGNGIVINASGDATVTCSFFQNNANGYGIEAGSNGTLHFNGVTFGGNGSGDYNIFNGSLVEDPNCAPIPGGGGGGSGGSKSLLSAIIPVTGDEKVTCDGSMTNITVHLPNGDHVILPCPINDFAFINSLPAGGLPAALDPGYEFISALTANVLKDNALIKTMEDFMVVSFIIPVGMENEEFAILYWDETAENGSGGWVELPLQPLDGNGIPTDLHDPSDGKKISVGVHTTEDGYVSVSVNFTGSFILVKK
ncbi:MAG: right-handed parallel beta-helix repeat-containing protein [Anaerolineales bacterium]|nr:MAG: right-handed parallel beta-helix repeat-containing protein [Anaerolineales bacterium]